jgi:hypothetical protein
VTAVPGLAWTLTWRVNVRLWALKEIVYVPLRTANVHTPALSVSVL